MRGFVSSSKGNSNKNRELPAPWLFPIPCSPFPFLVNKATNELLPDKYRFEERGVIHVNGKGEMLTCLVRRAKVDE